MPLNYSRWKHRITFALSPVTTVADRWVTLTLPWRVGINSDYSDIRFTNTAGNSLGYEIVSKTDRVTATIKIEIPTAGTRLIHLYYGNSQAASESTAAGTDDANPVLTAVSGTTNPEFSGAWTLRQGGRLNQQRYAARGGEGFGPYPEWKNEGLIQITNPVNQANYQHKLTLSWLPGMRSDFRDIRFAQINGKKCDYWIESYTSRTSAVVWIEVPEANQRWLNLYYGNGRAVSESNGDNTFLFFDDFEETSINAIKWPTGYASWTASTSTPYQGERSCYRSGTQVGLTSKVIEDLTYHIIECAARFNETNQYHYPIYCSNYLLVAAKNGRWQYYTGSAYANIGTLTYSANTWYKIKLILNKSINTYYVYIDDVLQGTITNNSGFNNNTRNFINLLNAAYGFNAGMYIDVIRVRKYSINEPTLSLIIHRPNSTRIIPYETLGDQPIGGTTYVMDPIESSLSLSGSIGATVLQPMISAGLDLTLSAPITTLSSLIESSLTLSGSAIGKLYIPLDELDLTQFSVSRGVSDDIWAMSATIDGLNEINTDVLRHATFSTTDHLGVSHAIFAGILPKSSYTIRDAANKTVISGYDYAWFLSRQQVQTKYQHNTAGTNPATVITGLLGGAGWEETTGIMPYKINPVTAWGNTLNSRVFDFPIGTTKKQAIDKICNYCRFVFMVRWIVVDGVATPVGYFVSEDDIDTDLDLPAPATFAYPDPYLAGEINPVAKGDERYNRVTVIGRNNIGGVFFKTVESESVTNGDELAVEKIENSGSWTTQDQVDARAAELYGYYSATAYTYTAKLLDRMDLDLLQKIKIVGYIGVSENWMRITRIKKTVRATKDGVEKLAEIEFTENVKWSALRRMYRYSSDDMTNEIETIVDGKINQMPGLQVGVCTEIDGQDGTVVLESGETITTRVV